jgi:hypothetical protein
LLKHYFPFYQIPAIIVQSDTRKADSVQVLTGKIVTGKHSGLTGSAETLSLNIRRAVYDS